MATVSTTFHEPPCYDVRIWRIVTYRGKTTTTHSFRWRVGQRRHSQTFATYRLAESFRAHLITAARAGEGFDADSGLPAAMRPTVDRTWYQHACDFAAIRWLESSPRHRKSTAEALTTLTPALATHPGASPPAELRRALFGWAFNANARRSDPPPEFLPALRWAESTSLPLRTVREPAQLDTALRALSTKLDGTPAATATIARKRASFHAALQYAVELGLLQANPLTRIRSTRRPTRRVERRVVINPDQAHALLSAVRQTSPDLEAYFACLYYAALRPGEARNLRRVDCDLPATGWGELLLTGSRQASGAAWTDTGQADEERPLKHRPADETRAAPAHPELITTLRHHLQRYPAGHHGHLFVTRLGPGGIPLSPPYSNPVSMSTIYRTWHHARNLALTRDQASSALARRPYDLRHACLSTWLNAGVPAAQVAAWAGHSTAVLLTVYAHCIDGQDEDAKRRIEAATTPENAVAATLDNPRHLPQRGRG